MMIFPTSILFETVLQREADRLLLPASQDICIKGGFEPSDCQIEAAFVWFLSIEIDLSLCNYKGYQKVYLTAGSEDSKIGKCGT